MSVSNPALQVAAGFGASYSELTLRDVFAAIAFARGMPPSTAYAHADALLAEREKETES